MNILVSITNLTTGGPAMFSIRLACGLVKHDQNKIILYDLYPQSSNKQYYQLISSNVKLIFFNPPKVIDFIIWKLNALFKTIFPSSQFSFWEKARNIHFKWILFYHNIEIINSHLFDSDWVLINILKNSKIPVITSMHGCYDFTNIRYSEKRGKFLKVLEQLKGIIYLSPKNLFILKDLALNENKFVIDKIYYGFLNQQKDEMNLDYREKLKINNDDFVFGMIARADKTKGWEEAILAFKNLTGKSKHKAHLILAFDDNQYSNSLKEYFKNETNTHFVGFISNPISLIKHFNVGLLPTYFATENCPNTIIEYLYCKKPVIATKHAEIPNMLIAGNEVAGKLINLDGSGKASIDELSKAMQSYLDDNALLAHHSTLTEKAFEKFNIEICVQKYMEVFRKVLNSQL